MTKPLYFLCFLALSLGAASPAGAHAIESAKDPSVVQSFDLVRARVHVDGPDLVFDQVVADKAGALKPTPRGQLAGSDVYSYVWPTSLNSSDVGFEADQGILALAMTAHPDFDDTPLYDENRDGNPKNDGDLWHSHWVVLVKDDACGPDALKVKDIPEGTHPRLPVTWPELPILIDSPGYEPRLKDDAVTIRVPLKDLAFQTDFRFDGVTAGLRVNESVHNPLLCVVDVHDVASVDLSLPGAVE